MTAAILDLEAFKAARKVGRPEAAADIQTIVSRWRAEAIKPPQRIAIFGVDEGVVVNVRRDER